MTLMRWDPFRNLSDSWAPAVDIFEKGDDLVIRAEVPGIERNDIELNVEDNTLVIRGERKQEQGLDENNVHRLERSHGKFVRSFRLPKTVDASKISAEYKNGILQVTLPKAELAKPRRVAI